MNWKELKSLEGIDQAIKESEETPVLIYKHSTRCSISAASLDRLERRWDDVEMGQVSAYYLDLISFRDVSNAIASKLGVVHQSPQAILLRNGKVVHEASHFGIDYAEIAELANSSQVA